MVMPVSRRALLGMVAATPLAAALGRPHDNDLTEAAVERAYVALPRGTVLFRKASTVTFHPDPRGHFQVTGFDATGRRFTERFDA